METVLNELLPRLITPPHTFLCIPHSGKSDLEASIPRKLRGWTEPETRFIVLRDQDSSDCRVVKQQLINLINRTGRAGVIVRIACRELESWYLADLRAVALAYGRPDLELLQRKAKFRDGDRLGSPSKELKSILPEFQKGGGAAKIAPFLDINNTRSSSFRAFITAVRQVVEEANQWGSRHNLRP